jgi:hypothetical protein
LLGIKAEIIEQGLSMKKIKQNSFEGVLIPESFDENGAPTEFALYTSTEDKFVIKPNFSLKILEEKIRNQVAVIGVLQIEGNKKIIKAQAITPLSSKPL